LAPGSQGRRTANPPPLVLERLLERLELTVVSLTSSSTTFTMLLEEGVRERLHMVEGVALERATDAKNVTSYALVAMDI
jgi:hypothetical protein